MALMNRIRLGLIQMVVTSDKAYNIKNAVLKISEAVKLGNAQIVCLPECFNSPYGTKYFAEYAESIPDGPSCQALMNAAIQHQIYIIGGSIPEIGLNNKIYNTCTVWSPSGDLLAQHRKVHLFDIEIPGKIVFKESLILSPGDKLTTFETSHGLKIGIGICYDIRFAEMAQIYSKDGCKLLVYPGAFNMTTGPPHWELLARARAVDNQVFIATPSPARIEKGSDYVAWGHSLVVDPWGEVIAQAGYSDEIIYASLDFDRLAQIRQQIPLTFQRRNDLYTIVNKTA